VHFLVMARMGLHGDEAGLAAFTVVATEWNDLDFSYTPP
jgi:hypothetical protein